eukprot:CAMPEP_0196182938 /NCGR_PEP_ID=MMETSP0911-20130528/30648_1 /TAXON_ID=49265 /ORGANISM="Thalassiosira rotula, Strain GSO102" /LENGTH=39 /DNA_ID= /DNA_START= /DNA_END= /DNA_ORIENTATION=
MLEYDIELGKVGRIVVEVFHWVFYPDDVDVLEEYVVSQH